MKRNIVKSISVGLALLLGLTSCAGGANKPANTPAPSTVADAKTGEADKPAGGQKMQVLLSEEPKDDNSFFHALKDWEAATGNIAETLVIPYDDQLTKFPSMAKTGTLPDLVSTTRLHQLYPEEFVTMNDQMDLGKFEPTALKIIGKDYYSEDIKGLPIQYTVTCLYYNIDAFEKAGITPPTEAAPWTWEELSSNAKILQEKGGVKYGFASDFSRARYDILMYANGGSLVEKSGDTFVVTANSKENVDTLSKFASWNNDGIMPKAIWAGGTTDNPADYFTNGDVGILLSGSWNYPKFKENIKTFKFGNMVSPKGKTQAAIIGGSALAVPTNAKNKEVAMSFLKWLYEDGNFKNYLQYDKGLSALTSVKYEASEDVDKENFVIIENEVKYVPDAFMIDESASWRKYLDNEYRDTLKKAVNGDSTAQEALDDFANALSQKSGWAIK